MVSAERESNETLRPRSEEVCYICCGTGADTRDHVIPDCFFPSPKPSNLLTLPAHLSCHNRLDEEYLRNLLASFGRDNSASAGQLWSRDVDGAPMGAVALAIGRNRPLLAAFRAGMVPRMPVYSPGGIYLGDAASIQFDRRRVYPSLEKMVRGLYCHHAGRLLPREVSFSWGLNEILYGMAEQVFAFATPGLTYGDIFDSRYIVEHEDGLEIVAWWLRFYNWTVFRCFLKPRPVS